MTKHFYNQLKDFYSKKDQLLICALAKWMRSDNCITINYR